MHIVKFPLGQLQANCYFLIKDDECLIIDPADEASFIMEELARRRLKLVGMLATHGHFDHVMAAGEMQISYVETSRRNVSTTLYLHQNDQFLINRLNETAKYFLGYTPLIIKPTSIKHLIEVKKKIREFRFNILHTAGHTPGSVCFYFEKEKVIFTGDTLFKRAIGRYDFSYSSKKDLKKSIKKILSLPKNVVVYPGHGEHTTIKDEMGTEKMVI